jgi:hypothetical protein
MKTEPIVKRGLELVGLMMIGEGVVGILLPTRYSRFWNIGPKWMRKTTTAFANHPNTTRVICAAEIAVGLWLAAHELGPS